MILALHAAVRAALSEALTSHIGLDRAALPAIVLQQPPTRTLGDLATPVAFELARQLRKAPRAIAQDIVAALGPIEGVARVEATSNGYVNVFLDRAAFVRAALASPGSLEAGVAAADIPRDKTIVEHTAINPNKAAHIGHLRNATLGDTLVRMLRACGVTVEVQNYIDDTGVQVADVVVGFERLEGKSLDEIHVLADSTRFDYYCWDLYARVTEWYEADRTRLDVRRQTLHAIERGGNPSAETAAFIADRIVRAHLETMGRLNVDYDLLSWEGDILRLKFWSAAFEILRESGALFLQDEGKLAGCWVMPIDESVGAEAADSPSAPDDPVDEGEQREKVIVRSDGTVTYVGKDIAYQVLEVRPARPRLPLSPVRIASRRRHVVGHDERADARRDGSGSSLVRQGGRRLQRHRHAPDVSAEAAEAGADHVGPRTRVRAVDAFLLRNGGSDASHRARAGLRDCGGRKAVRRSVGAQRSRREG